MGTYPNKNGGINMKKTLVRFLCVCTLLVIGLLPLTASAKTNVGYFYVNTNDYNGLKLRTSAVKMSDDSNLICRMPHRSYVLVYEYNKNKTWAYVEVQNPNGSGTVKGWCMTQFLSAKDPGPVKPQPKPVDPSNTIENLNKVAQKIQYLGWPMDSYIITKNVGACVHLRAFPDTRAVFYGEYYANTDVTILAMSSKWALVQINADGKVGYILADNVVHP